MANHGARGRPALRLTRFWQLLGWGLVLAVVVLSLTPAPPTVDTGWDKTNHLLGYGVLMWWFYQAFTARLLWALMLLLLGALLELLQGLTGFRQAEVADMVANACGVGLGWLAAITPAGRLLLWLDRSWR